MALNEVRILASVNHDNVIAYKDAFFDVNNLCIIMEFADGGDLMKKVESAQKARNPIKEADIW